MPSISVATYSDPEQYESAYIGAKAEILPHRPGPFSVQTTRIVFNKLWLAAANESAACVKHVAQRPERAFITFVTQPGADVTVDGVVMPPAGIMRHCAAHTYHEHSDGAMFRGALSLPVEDMLGAGAAMIGRALAPPRDTLLVTPPAWAMDRLLRLHRAARMLADTAPETILLHSEVARGLEQALVEAMVTCQGAAESREERWAQRCHQMIMRRFRRVLEENPDRALYIPEICVAIGVPGRTLRMCCQEHLRMGPKQYLLLRRIHLARRALRAADPNVSTVTDIATTYGFWHFGRFATFYHSIFGELPSATLRQQST